MPCSEERFSPSKSSTGRDFESASLFAFRGVSTQYIGSSSCTNNSSNTSFRFCSDFSFASLVNSSKNAQLCRFWALPLATDSGSSLGACALVDVVATAPTLELRCSKPSSWMCVDKGSEAGGTETNAPNSTSGVASEIRLSSVAVMGSLVLAEGPAGIWKV